MKASIIIVSLLALSIFIHAADKTLNANPSITTTFESFNCDGVDGPFKKSVTLQVENPTSSLMEVFYQRWDFPTGAWVDSGKLCNVPPGPGVTENCPTELRIALGGSGSETTTQALLRLTADVAGDTYTKDVSFTFKHRPGDSELRLLSAIENNNTFADQVEATCETAGSCCSDTERALLSQARDKLNAAGLAVHSCSLAAAYQDEVSVEGSIRQAKTSTETCLAAGTPTPPPTTPAPTQTRQTPAPTSTPTGGGGPTATPAATPAPASACPFGAILLFGFVFLASRRVRH